ncbi:MAG TPA: hypothetical protein VHK70_05885 [Burkholderiaceae bacterium]|nr:hypothetical protein [Burkholderiaceae bacterium]
MKKFSILIAAVLLSSCAGMNSSGSSGSDNEFKGPGSPTDYIAMASGQIAAPPS